MDTRYIRYIFTCAVAALVLILAGCRDEIEFVRPVPTDGDVTLSADIMFKPLAMTDVTTGSRAGAPAGSQFKNINSLYILFFDTDRKRIDQYSGPVEYELTDVARPEGTNEGETIAESSTPSGKFSKTVSGGQYYIYAVANVDRATLDAVTTIDELRSLPLHWDPERMDRNLAMFGVFRSSTGDSGTVDNTGFEDDVLLTVSASHTRIHSWLRRATSKVTVSFDGSALLDDVTVYIRSARLVDVASSCPLGCSIAGEEVTTTGSSFVIDYGSGDEVQWASWPMVDNKHNLSSYTEPGSDTPVDMHSELARALPCYENLQGTRPGKPKYQDANGDGVIDNPDASAFNKDGVSKGTYLEVEGYYVSKHKNYATQGAIKYRFMLGMNAENDFNVLRNHHYKVTMAFKGFGNEVDWHVDFNEMVFGVTQPHDVNYLGKFFVPDSKYSGNNQNLGHTFTDQNTITVTSYSGTDNAARFDPVQIWYKDDSMSEFSLDRPSWIAEPKIGDIVNSRMRDITFEVKPDYTEIDIDDRLKKNTQKGNASTYYNLSNSSGAAAIEETANCYIVDAPGYYTFPLVYGNAYNSGCQDGNNKDAYINSTGALPNFHNHLATGITDPFIVNNAGCTPTSVYLVWQDEAGLVSNIKYDKNAFKVNGKAMGGITFQITSDKIQQGNALIAIKDASGMIMWSWHIWVTDLSFDKTVTVSNNWGNYEVMNFNLGWCADKVNNVRRKLRYYPRRWCDIKIVNTHGAEETVRIERYPHTVMPCGDNPAYQWGRKDPFPGRISAYDNKVLYLANGTTRWQDPERFWLESDKNTDREALRQPTTWVLYRLIREPEKWHNPPREFKNGMYTSSNYSFSNLWSRGDGKMLGPKYKTVYDPCPPGYQVCHSDVFSLFTTTGNASFDPRQWLDVAEVNMATDYYGGADKVSSQVIEFYTDKTRLQSIAIPLNGYRDWDAKAEVYEFGKKGYVWTNLAYPTWELKNASDMSDDEYNIYIRNNAYYLEVSRYYNSSWTWETQSSQVTMLRVVRPANGFLNTDGCPIRPVAYK